MELKKLFEKLLRCKSVTPNDDGAFNFIEKYLLDFKIKRIDIEDTKNLFLYKKFGEGEHLCFAGHIDVVPAGEGWSSNPFEPTYRDGYIFARGSQDMKSGVSAFLKMAKELKNFNGTLSILLTSDEEGDAINGTVKVLEYLKEINFLPKYAIIAEPTSDKIFGDNIKIGRRGSINGVIEIKGVQGHAAYPQNSINPIHQIAKVLPNIGGIDLDGGDENFAPSKFVITDIRSGMEVTNVTPAKLKMMFNVRNSTKTDKRDVKNFVEKNFKGLNYTLNLSQTAKPFVTNRNSKIVKLLDKIVKSHSTTSPKLTTSGGTSDARFFGEFGVDTVEFGVINDTIHSVDERTTIHEVQKLYEIFCDLTKQF